MQEQKPIEYNKLLDSAEKVIRKGNVFSKKLIESNFDLGGIVVSLIDSAEYGDKSVEKFATDLTKKCGYTIYPQRLWESSRVYRTFAGDINKIWKLEYKIGTKITWTFLVKNCTKAPTEGAEAEVYWEGRLKQYEEAISEVEQFSMERERHLDKAPEKAKEQIKGFLAKIDNEGVKTTVVREATEEVLISDNGDRLKALLDRFDGFLSELDKIENEIDGETEQALLSIYNRIQRILEKNKVEVKEIY